MAYSPINWQDFPNEETPLSSFNLNHMDLQIKANADKLDTPASTDEIGLVKPDGETISIDEEGTISLTGLSGIATESPITSATGNINAITLYGESRKSKNLLKSTIGTTTIGNVTFTSNGDGTYTLNNNGTVTQSSISPNGSELMSLGSGTYKYIVSNNENIRARVIEDIDGARTEKANATKEVTFTASSNAKYLFQIWTTSNATYSNVVIKPMLTTDTTLTYADYEQHGIITADGEVECSSNGQTSSINASTICPNYKLHGIDTIKNTLEVYADGSGKFVSKIGSVNLGSLTWNYASGNQIFNANIDTFNVISPSLKGVNGICARYEVSTDESMTLGGMTNNTIKISWAKINSTTKYITIKDTSYSDATSFKNAMNGQILLYELATPTETPLTAEEVAQFLALKTFKGTTNINADCGYKISYYLDNNVAQGIANVGTRTETNTIDIASTKAMISDAWSSSKTYAQGEFCIYNNALWKSKVSSNTGNTPTESSYWTSTSIGERIKNSLEMRSTVTKNIGTTIGANATVGINSGINAIDNDICITRQTGTYGVCITPFINANNIWCANVMNLTSSSIPTGLGIKFDILNK